MNNKLIDAINDIGEIVFQAFLNAVLILMWIVLAIILPAAMLYWFAYGIIWAYGSVFSSVISFFSNLF